MKIAWHICSSWDGKVICPMNLTHKKTPINSHRTAKKNNLLQAAKLIICEERQELQHVSDWSRGRGPFLQPQAGRPCRSVVVCRKLRPGRVLLLTLHSLGGTCSKLREGRAAGEGASRKSSTLRTKQLKGQVPTRTWLSFRQRSPSCLNSLSAHDTINYCWRWVPSNSATWAAHSLLPRPGRDALHPSTQRAVRSGSFLPSIASPACSEHPPETCAQDFVQGVGCFSFLLLFRTSWRQIVSWHLYHI